jgi:hypothetical protein
LKRKDNNINIFSLKLLKEKKTIFIISFFLLTVNSFAQKLFTKSLNSNAEKIIIEFNIIDKIELITSNEKNLFFIAAESENESPPRITLKEENGIIFIKSNEDFYEDRNIDIDKLCSVQPDYSSYLIKIPQGKKIEISYTQGNFYSNNFAGNLNLKIEEGTVKIKKFEGSVFVYINIGNVYINGIKNTELTVKSNLGTIFSNLKKNGLTQKRNQLNGVFEENRNQLKIDALLANIHLSSSIN